MHIEVIHECFIISIYKKTNDDIVLCHFWTNKLHTDKQNITIVFLLIYLFMIRRSLHSKQIDSGHSQQALSLLYGPTSSRIKHRALSLNSSYHPRVWYMIDDANVMYLK